VVRRRKRQSFTVEYEQLLRIFHASTSLCDTFERAIPTMKISYRKFELPFQYPFSISGGRTKTVQPSLIVCIEHHGIRGYGEAPAIHYYNIPVERMIADLESRISELEAFPFSHPEAFGAFAFTLFPENSFLVCALDMAAWDLYGKLQQKPLYQLWKTEWKNLPLSDYTLGIDEIPVMLRKMDEHPWPIYKVKLGSEKDIEIIQALRSHTSAPLRIDVNGGWTLQEAFEKIQQLSTFGIELIEQPLSKEERHLMPQLKAHSSIPLIADESCVREEDVQKCAEGFHGINIKLTKCGGISPALRMIKTARQLGLTVMMGNMNESSIGTAAIAQFLPQLDFVDMDGPLLLAQDLATGLQLVHGQAQLSHLPGLGIEPSFDDSPIPR
jgi:L-alanine-DL-glutamate epimerase-like enolase superfamily enzyme